MTQGSLFKEAAAVAVPEVAPEAVPVEAVEAVELDAPSPFAGRFLAEPAAATAPYVRPARGHYCLYEQRGETCPGPAGCNTVGAKVTDNPCAKGGVRDGFRCLNCSRWDERAERIAHRTESCVVRPPAKRGRR